ncbi:MAG: flagellar basal body rod protein FlgB [Rickettsiaceae bacterium]|nr:flagellar basal body rod protein FlgB [Rickettsiaceae bacterium]
MSVTNAALEAFMHYGVARQEKIAENIANANTPGKKAEDIKIPKDFAEMIKSSYINPNQISLAVTNSGHIAGLKPKIKFRAKERKDTDVKPNGNDIDLAREALAASDNKTKYYTALKAYQANLELHKTVLGKK